MKPTGPEAYLKPKELISLGAHPISAVWFRFSTPVSSAWQGRLLLPSSWSESTTALSLARPAWTLH
ncbi:hypothetical protein K443DRAFT_677407 [Laccaria amethystina LaAM-08-1]|uniref:Uncharacterized protein n=1 Tax=Laccaria amethystina LaAM-08-1 TaxID=1095629 RepID=A0A0C9Y3J1_9AGAR|nr:hypothetical protein K443DRAFT_677407 [Laccaria amethystina LaAM-08-1]